MSYIESSVHSIPAAVTKFDSCMNGGCGGGGKWNFGGGPGPSHASSPHSKKSLSNIFHMKGKQSQNFLKKNFRFPTAVTSSAYAGDHTMWSWPASPKESSRVSKFISVYLSLKCIWAARNHVLSFRSLQNNLLRQKLKYRLSRQCFVHFVPYIFSTFV